MSAYMLSESIPFGPNTLSDSFILPSSHSFMMPAAVISLETEAIRIMCPASIFSPASSSAQPKPLAYTSLPFRVTATDAPFRCHSRMKLVIIRSIFFVDSRSESALLIRRFTAVGSGSMSQPLSSDVDENRFQGPSMAKIIAAATKSAVFLCFIVRYFSIAASFMSLACIYAVCNMETAQGKSFPCRIGIFISFCCREPPLVS